MGCTNALASLVYFNSFIILVSYAMLNLFVAVVIEQFGEVCNAVCANYCLMRRTRSMRGLIVMLCCLWGCNGLGGRTTIDRRPGSVQRDMVRCDDACSVYLELLQSHIALCSPSARCCAG